MSSDDVLRDQILERLRMQGAHADFKHAIEGLPAKLRGERAAGSPFTPWRLLEHMRIAQWDILEFCRNPKHVSPDWPQGYWPAADAPANAAAWNRSVADFERESGEMQAVVADRKTDLFARIPHGTGQTILREALLVADHNAYHLGQFILLRRLLGAWSD